jgi:hypothetical protein
VVVVPRVMMGVMYIMVGQAEAVDRDIILQAQYLLFQANH